ncbi:FAD-dependent oxidoreductase [Candidatus Pacearchaeota archaeon]|nr:FAD-dependent oxidoreductase [Candidatus Pacearchaeota archaeon]
MEKKEEKEHFHIFKKHHKDEEIVHYDVCILGGGPAGLTSAIYAGRYGMHTAVISRDIGGMANLAHKIENYPGYEGSGFELMQKFQKQAKKFKAEFLNSEAANIHKDKTGFIIELMSGEVVHSKTIIIALGTEKKKLKIPGEERFLGKGVSYCATCDANFFKKKIVAIVGGGDSACKAAMLLSGIAKRVYLIYRGEELKCQIAEKTKIIKGSKIEIIYNCEVIEINGKEKVKSIVVKENKKIQEIKVDGIFIEIGSIPSTSVIKKLGVNNDEEGYIIVDHDMKTNIKGIFAAGDAINSKLKQIIVSAGQGAIAAKSAHDFLK